MGVGVRGATIAGGGVPAGDSDPDFTGEIPNKVWAHYGTVGGGFGNNAGSGLGTVLDGAFATVAGGNFNLATGYASFVGSGYHNIASGESSSIGGGIQNTASGFRSMVMGGEFNVASGQYSFAGGLCAKTQTAGGTPTVHDGPFVWADNNFSDFNSASANEFAARATGDVRFVTAIDGVGTPTRTVSINANGEVSFGNVTRQMLNLYGQTWGIGVPTATPSTTSCRWMRRTCCGK